ncbi:arylamine N-acetyltransferase [Antarcticibacterium sp. 1MA-6-2]|uniref:arylamine N-acetyltransferase family protein n=1 Tax=Antarcticibacterium sp. 1MA-6-2 TaxID=2908210 RepID=UPI001F1F7418|nr:arylamine N-acetyltransferase [Antarcticibacterium sp. 1MA-6-2]UJH91015.1 arylamine N-acetyltransferase [Antarcticibacterium sp. 1MA-6-2]
MDLQHYLKRIHYKGKTEVSIETLNFLHRAHVLNVPFENFHVINRIPIVLDQEKFYSKVVERKRGGFCYELNGLFAKALEEIGFDNYFIGCSVFVPPLNDFGSNFGHLAIITSIDEQLFLVDVGFGDAFLEPLELKFDEPVFQFGFYYRLTQLPNEEILLEKSLDNESYQKMYKFTLKKRDLQDFAETCEFHQVSPLAPFTKKPLCSRATSAGRITLTSTSLTITNGQQKKEVPILSSSQFDELLEEHFGMKFTADPDLVA